VVLWRALLLLHGVVARYYPASFHWELSVAFLQSHDYVYLLLLAVARPSFGAAGVAWDGHIFVV
jgi:hypothetical protein